MRVRAAAVLAAALSAVSARAQEVVAVLGSDLPPYQEAYRGLEDAFGRPVALLPKGGTLPRGVKVVVAFGGKAAVQHYPDDVTLIYGIAPGLEVAPDTHDGVSARIHMEPAAAALLSGFLEVQPNLRRLAVLWSSAEVESEAKVLAKAGSAASVQVLSEHLSGADELPDRLRLLRGRVDALWLPADPLLINAQSFETLRQYAYANGLAFFAPTDGLVERGATAAVWVDFREIGRTAAAAAKDALAGGELPAEIYADHGQISVNLTAAKASSLTIPPEVLRKAGKVFR